MTAIDPFGTTTEQSTGIPGNESSELDCQGPAEKQESEFGSFEIPRPLLTMQQAAAFLGKSVRAIERSLMGRWGNKLPEGWSARKVKTDKGEEWRILPPPGFRVRSHGYSPEASGANSNDYSESSQSEFVSESTQLTRRGGYRQEHSIEQPTIVIDRSEEVENLLRELLVTQKALSEERRLHMEDLRFVGQLQGHMRLLESSSSESAKAKQELEYSKRELEQLKEEYNHIVALPWWKRLFGYGFKRN